MPLFCALLAGALSGQFQMLDGWGELLPEGAGGTGSSASSADLAGHVTHVRDGDTIEVAGVPVRIANLDCAELDTEEGQSAGLFMRDLVRGQTVTCDLEGRMSHDREVGTCALANTGEDLGEILIGEGVCGRWH
jgi:endonuclease YncB( thermonuclease family)